MEKSMDRIILYVNFALLLYLVWSYRTFQAIDRYVPDDRKFPTTRVIEHPKYGAKLKCFTNADDIVCSTILRGDVWEEPLFQDVIKPHVKPHSTVLDCGAYVGSHSLLISKIDPSIDILAFEMMPEHYKLVQDNIRLNELPNMLAFNCALSNENGRITIPEVDYQKEDKVNYGGVALDQAKSSGSSVSIAAMTLDTFLPWIRKPVSLIKIDVEGHEIPALSGAKQVLMTFRPVIVIEIWKKNYDKFIQSEIWEFCSKRLRYRIEPIAQDDYLLTADRH